MMHIPQDKDQNQQQTSIRGCHRSDRSTIASKIWHFPSWKCWLQEFSWNVKERIISLSRYKVDTILYPQILWHIIHCKISRSSLHLQNLSMYKQKPCPFQMLLIFRALTFRLPGEEVPSATRKSKELIINVRLQGGNKQLFIKLVDSRANSIQWWKRSCTGGMHWLLTLQTQNQSLWLINLFLLL